LCRFTNVGLYTNLDNLLEKKLSIGTEEDWRYRLTLLKKSYQSTRPAKIKANLADLDTVQTLYLDLSPFQITLLDYN